jgi:hypothetical protein
MTGANRTPCRPMPSHSHLPQTPAPHSYMLRPSWDIIFRSHMLKEMRPDLHNPLTLRACLKGWPVGSVALPGAHFRVWPPFPLPRPGPLEAKPPPAPGSSRTPFSTVARGLGSARRWAGDFGALCAGGRWPWRARAGEGKVPPALLRREIHGL